MDNIQMIPKPKMCGCLRCSFCEGLSEYGCPHVATVMLDDGYMPLCQGCSDSPDQQCYPKLAKPQSE
jgi:hypothetical protein